MLPGAVGVQQGGFTVVAQSPVQAAGGAAPRVVGAGQKRKAKGRPARPQGVNQQAPPVVVAPVEAVVTPAAVAVVDLVVDEVVPPAISAVVPAGKKVKVWCWKCASKTHAIRDCTARHYCYICDNDKHAMERCPALKLPKPVTFVAGMGHGDTGFNQFPDCVFREHLAPEVFPTA